MSPWVGLWLAGTAAIGTVAVFVAIVYGLLGDMSDKYDRAWLIGATASALFCWAWPAAVVAGFGVALWRVQSAVADAIREERAARPPQDARRWRA